MKPVNLLPGDAVVAKAASGKPNLAAIGGGAAAFVAIVAIAGYFAMSRVDSIKSETEAHVTATSTATSEAAAIESQVASIGQPVVDSDRQLAQGAEQVLVSSYSERYDYVLLAQELRGIMPSEDGWYVKVTAGTNGASTDSGDAGEGQAVTITGVAESERVAASFNDRANATLSLDNASLGAIESVYLRHPKTLQRRKFWKFTVTADFTDLVAPVASGATGADPTGTVVGSGADEGSITLSLDSRPPSKATAKPAAKPKAKVEAPAAPRNPFDVAATTAAGGKP